MADNDSGTHTKSTVLPTSDAQREILATVALGDDASCAFNMCVQLDFAGRVDIDALKKAVASLGERHQLLRAKFATNGQSMQIDAQSDVELNIVDLSERQSVDTQFALRQLRHQEVTQAFDLFEGHAWRIHCLRLDGDKICIILTVHHVIVDGWSLTTLRDNLEALYNAHAKNKEPDLEPAIPFEKYLHYLNDRKLSGDRQAARDYWIGQFSSGVPVLDMPIDYSRPPKRTYAAARCDVRVPRDVSDTLRKMAQDQGYSLFNVLFSAFYCYLYRSSSADDIVIGVPSAGHSAAGLYEMVGHCVNILPVRQKISGEFAYADFLNATRSCMLDAQDHQTVTFSELIGALDLERDASRIPLVSMLFNIDQDPGLHDFDGSQARASSVPHKFENFEIFCNVLDRDGCLTIEWAYNTQLFSSEATEHRVHSFIALLTQIAHAPKIAIDDIGLFSTIDREIVERVNATHLDLPEVPTVLPMLQSAGQANPEAEALVAGQSRYSYRALDEKSSQFANYLNKQGVVKGDWVALCLERNEHMVVAIIALMKLGATYVPLDPAYPADRVAYIIDDADASLVITQSHLLSSLPEHNGENICVDEIAAQIDKQPSSTPDVEPLGPNDLVYVIYTSGSTGNPKGVKLKHVNVANFLTAMEKKPGLAASDRLVAVTTLSFDIAVLELLLPLTVGACVIVASRHEATDADALQALISQERATTLQATPATWRMLLQGGWQGQKDLKALIGGEALPRDLAQQLATSTSELWNMYGPTETAIWSTCEKIGPDSGPVLIGSPIGNTKVYVLDDLGHPAPIGQPGELLIGGEGVCAGYHRRDDLTDQVFIPDVFATDPDARLYRTRDRVKFLPDGRLEYLERMDNQVKVRGYRIELGEIETVLSEQQGVMNCAVLAREDTPGDVRLVAYVCCEEGCFDSPALASGLGERLPTFMLPQHYVLLEEMPRTPNGKLDRKSLPLPSLSQRIDQFEKIMPRTATERWVAERWSELIDVTIVGKDDNFFALGGHSLLAMRFIAESRKAYEGSISLRTVLSDSVSQIAATLNPGDIPVVEASAAVAVSSRRESKLDLYFSKPHGKNFLCAYHSPADGVAPRQAVLLVQSIGHEYQRGHRAMQEIAVTLSQSGCAVLRFDYRDTGDSSGEFSDLRLNSLQQDLISATDELIAKSGCQEVGVLSLRLGALLVDSVADDRWSRHFAWDPVMDGAEHCQLLKKMHAKSMNDLDRYRNRRATNESGLSELVGYEYSPDFVRELSSLSVENKMDLKLILSNGVCSDEELQAIRLHLTPEWDNYVHAEAHLQIPADLGLLTKTVMEIE